MSYWNLNVRRVRNLIKEIYSREQWPSKKFCYFPEAIEAPVTAEDPKAVVNLKNLNKACNDEGIENDRKLDTWSDLIVELAPIHCQWK